MLKEYLKWLEALNESRRLRIKLTNKRNDNMYSRIRKNNKRN